MVAGIGNCLAADYVNSKSKSYAISSQEQPDFKLHLNLGESLIGPSHSVLWGLKEVNLEDLFEYPETSLAALKKSLSDFYGVDKKAIILGTGSDTLIETIPRIFSNPGEISLATAPEFFRFKDAHLRSGSLLEFIERDEKEDFGFTDSVLKELIIAIYKIRPPVVWISNPNNPSGRVASPVFIREIQKVTEEADGIFVCDEAYGEFNDLNGKVNSSIDLVREGRQRMIVLRTFSKAYGLAGIRVGYGIISKDIAASGLFNEWMLPYDVSNIGAKLAVMALNDQGHMDYVREETARRRSKIDGAFDSNPKIRAISGSVINTILARMNNGENINDRLAEAGVKVCNQDSYEGTNKKGYARITVGTPGDVKGLCNIVRGL